jgi:hypothetical protein
LTVLNPLEMSMNAEDFGHEEVHRMVKAPMAIALWRGMRDDGSEEERRGKALRRRMREVFP